MRVLTPAHDVYLINLISINQIPNKIQAILHTEHILIPGDRFQALGEITARRIDPALDDVSFYQRQLNGKTPIIISRLFRLKILPGRPAFRLERLRYRLLQRLDARLGASAPFTKALLFNDRTEDREWIQQLIQGGLIHLIAISGMNIILLFMIMKNLLGLAFPRRTSEVIFLLLMVVYAGLCQWSPPVCRAIIIILLYLIAKWLQRPVSPVQLISFSLLIITAIDPVQLFSVGLQLSYLSVLSLVLFMPKFVSSAKGLPAWEKQGIRIEMKLLKYILASIIIALVMIPIMLYYFQRASLNSIPGTVLGSLLMWCLLPLALTLLVLPSGWFIYDWLKATFGLLEKGFDLVVKFSASLPFYVDRTTISLTWLVVAYLVLIALLVRWKGGYEWRRAAYAILLLIIPLAVFSLIPKHRPFTLTAFNAGQGDCILVQYPGGQNLMIDTGPVFFNANDTETKSWFGSRMAGWQRHLGITDIDLLILTHSDNDHSGGLSDILHNLRVHNLLFSHATANLPNIIASCGGYVRSIPRVSIIEDTMSFNFAGSRLSVLHPGKDYASSGGNSGSLVVRLDYHGWSALLAGDISSAEEQLLVDTVPEKLDVDWLKAPHHGSAYSNSSAFIKAVSPSQVCITAGLHNRFGFPAPVTLARYRKFGLEPRITANGSVIETIH